METDSVDVLLRQYAECREPARAETLLEQLVVQYAQAGMRKVVPYKLAFQGQWRRRIWRASPPMFWRS